MRRRQQRGHLCSSGTDRPNYSDVPSEFREAAGIVARVAGGLFEEQLVQDVSSVSTRQKPDQKTLAPWLPVSGDDAMLEVRGQLTQRGFSTEHGGITMVREVEPTSIAPEFKTTPI